MYQVLDYKMPGLFSKQVAADSRRLEFDYKNEVIVANNVPVEFVFLGDSITHMWQLDAYFQGKNGLVLNRGIGGDTTEYALKRFEADVVQLKPKYCVAMVGVNNSWCVSENPVYRIKEKPMEPVIRQIVDDTAAMVELAQKNGIGYILCSILAANPILTYDAWKITEVVIEANKFLKELAKEKKLIYVDYYAAFVETDGKTMKQGLSYDGVHPHAMGYNLMAEVLRKTLKENGVDI